MRCGLFCLFCGLCLFLAGQQSKPVYPWLSAEETVESLEKRIAPPTGYIRTMADHGSFALWLRCLPVKPEDSPVRLFNGKLKSNQAAHFAVIALDTGSRDLQQCADAVIRLRAEYLFSRKRLSDIAFHFTSGHLSAFSRWARGERPQIRGNRVTWRYTAAADATHASLRRYLTSLFIYAGSCSLEKEMMPRLLHEMKIGDVFVQGGFPGHAVLVVDRARHKRTGEKVFLLAQSYMPAQEMHVLRNPNDRVISPWYRMPAGGTLVTPEWTFRSTDLKKFAR